MSAFDHPRRELDDLLRWKSLLHHKATDHGVADAERSGGLLHGNPEALIRWRARRKAIGVANVLHALLRPGVAVAGAIAQPIQDRDDGAIFTDQSELANQLARPVLAYRKFGMGASGPVQLEMNCGRTVRGISDDLLEHGTQDALLQCDWRAR